MKRDLVSYCRGAFLLTWFFVGLAGIVGLMLYLFRHRVYRGRAFASKFQTLSIRFIPIHFVELVEFKVRNWIYLNAFCSSWHSKVWSPYLTTKTICIKDFGVSMRFGFWDLDCVAYFRLLCDVFVHFNDIRFCNEIQSKEIFMASQLKVYVGLAHTLAPAGKCTARTARCSNAEDEVTCCKERQIAVFKWIWWAYFASSS